MSTTVQTPQTIPAGTWNADLLHSSVGFAVRHMVVSTFRGDVPVVEASLEATEAGSRLVGVAQVASIKTQDENLDAHIQAPDFLDAQRHPELRFASTDIERQGESDVIVRGEMTVKGITRPVELRGELVGPVEDPYGNSRLGLELTTKFDRRDYDLNWQSPLPGGGLALGYEITLTAHLELVKA
jgi:polyisoprenoid-binding protein YceI